MSEKKVKSATGKEACAILDRILKKEEKRTKGHPFIQTNKKLQLEELEIKDKGTLIEVKECHAHNTKFIMNGIDMCKKFDIRTIELDITNNKFATIKIEMNLHSPCSIFIKDGEIDGTKDFILQHSDDTDIMMVNDKVVGKAHVKLHYNDSNVI